MNQKLLQKMQRMMLFLTIILLPLSNLPKTVTFSSIGQTASLYPLFFSLFLFIVEYTKYKFVVRKCFVFFVCVYASWQIICVVNGVLIYPYYNLIEVEQAGKLKYIIEHVPIFIGEENAIKIWSFIRECKNAMLQTAILFVVPCQILHLYSGELKKAFRDIRKAVVVLVCILGIYSIPEIMFLKLDNRFASLILEWLNPLFYDVQSAHGWWPPLLWPGQLRSICTEPSYFGIIATFCIPFCWSYLNESGNIKYVALYIYFIFMLFMTKARTALGIYGGELALLILSCLNYWDKKLLRTIALILVTTAVAFSANLINWRDGSTIDGEEYFNENIASVAEKGARSNTARFANTLATFKVGAEHKIFGVGKGFKDAYITEQLPEWSYNDPEVRNWARYLRTEGISKSGYPTLNYYATAFAESGIFGLGLFLLPVFYVFYSAYKKRRELKSLDAVIVLVVFCGQLAAMLSNTYFLTYPLSLGLALLLTESERIY